MTNTSRRSFLGASLAAFSSIPAFGQEKLTEPLVKVPDDPAFQPATLFLTWQRDPTTTMTVQWIGAVGETSDTKVTYAPVKADKAPDPTDKPTKPADGSDKASAWAAQDTAVRPYPMSDLK